MRCPGSTFSQGCVQENEAHCAGRIVHECDRPIAQTDGGRERGEPNDELRAEGRLDEIEPRPFEITECISAIDEHVRSVKNRPARMPRVKQSSGQRPRADQPARDYTKRPSKQQHDCAPHDIIRALKKHKDLALKLWRFSRSSVCLERLKAKRRSGEHQPGSSSRVLLRESCQVPSTRSR